MLKLPASLNQALSHSSLFLQDRRSQWNLSSNGTLTLCTPGPDHWWWMGYLNKWGIYIPSLIGELWCSSDQGCNALWQRLRFCCLPEDRARSSLVLPRSIKTMFIPQNFNRQGGDKLQAFTELVGLKQRGMTSNAKEWWSLITKVFTRSVLISSEESEVLVEVIINERINRADIVQDISKIWRVSISNTLESHVNCNHLRVWRKFMVQKINAFPLGNLHFTALRHACSKP